MGSMTKNHRMIAAVVTCAVHLALLSTGEDRTKAMLSWAWAGFTHERVSRTVVGAGEES